MFDLDKWQEIFSTMRKNKLRTILTAFSVAWGIFILIVLLGSGNGLKNAIMVNFESDAKNLVMIYPEWTSIDYNGYKKNRRIKFDSRDTKILDNQSGIDIMVPVLGLWSSSVSHGSNYGSFSSRGVYPDIVVSENLKIERGRFINDTDIRLKRKVVAIGTDVVKTVFPDTENPIGEYVKINNSMFRVIGIYKDADWDNRYIYMPFSTAQMLQAGKDQVSHFQLTTAPEVDVDESKLIKTDLRKKLAALHQFSPDDERAVWISNDLENYESTQKLFGGINIFIWLIGIGTLISGIVGVSNIMMIVVKERTREIGVRKALGARPSSVVGLVLSEAVSITLIAGYFGMVFGVAVMELVDYINDQIIANTPATTDAAGNIVMFLNPNADLSIAIGATVLLVICGAIAGLIPALKAARIKPIEALRYE